MPDGPRNHHQTQDQEDQERQQRPLGLAEVTLRLSNGHPDPVEADSEACVIEIPEDVELTGEDTAVIMSVAAARVEEEEVAAA